MYEAKKISKTYITRKRENLFKMTEEKKVALKDVDIKIEQGKVVSLLGINGAGKTTLIKIMSTLLEPTSGQVIYEGKNAFSNTNIVKKNINVITGGERNLFWRLSAYENLRYFGALYGLRGKELEIKIDGLLELVDLKDEKFTPVERYSKGMKQRLQIAKGLINDPKYLFLDEPTLGLDVQIATEIRQYVSLLAKEQNKGILLTSHYINEVQELSDYIYILSGGEVMKKGTIDNVVSSFDVKYKYIIMGFCNYKIDETFSGFKFSINYFGNGKFELIITSKDQIFNTIMKKLIENNVVIESIEEKKPTLEEVLLLV